MYYQPTNKWKKGLNHDFIGMFYQRISEKRRRTDVFWNIFFAVQRTTVKCICDEATYNRPYLHTKLLGTFYFVLFNTILVCASNLFLRRFNIYFSRRRRQRIDLSMRGMSKMARLRHVKCTIAKSNRMCIPRNSNTYKAPYKPI